MNKQKQLIFILIVLVATILRFYKLDQYPVGFHIDEASLGYNAYSLAKTGRDENSLLFPLHIDMFGDFRPAGYQYLDILPIKLFGLNEFATRFPSALFGAATTVAIFLLTVAIFENYTLGLLAAGLTAFSPWHIVISRASAETIVALFFIILGAYFFLSGIKGKTRQFFWATVFWLASLFFYHSSRVFVPLLGIIFSALAYPLWQKKKRNFKLGLFLSLLVIFFLSLFLVFGAGGGAGRFRQVSIFHFPEIRLVLEEQIREDGVAGMPIILTRSFHNKVVNYGFGYLKEYFRYFSLNFLFIEGGFPLWYQVPNMGLMYIIELPFLFVGLYLLIKNSAKNRLFLIPMIWLFLGPTVAALTRDDVPNVQRSLVMLPALSLITAYGLWGSLEWVKEKFGLAIQKLTILVLVLLFCWNFSYFLHQYYIHSRVHRPWYRFNGFKEMVLAVNELEPDYDKVVVTKSQGGIYMHFLFFQKFDPEEYQKLGSPKDKDYQGFGKLVFVPGSCPTDPLVGSSKEPDAKVLFVASGTCEEPPFSSEETKLIKREDGTVAFRIYPGEGRNE